MNTTLFLVAALFALFEVPLFTVILAIGMGCFYFVDNDMQALQMILIEMNRLASMPVLVALPLFTLSGCILTESNAPKRIMNMMESVLGWLPGGFAIAALLSSSFFTALTGASGVTIVALGSIIYPILKKQGYSEKFTLGLITTAGSLGLLFPPSLPVILYGVISGSDIAEIFKAAFVPGVLLILALCFYSIIRNFSRQKGVGAAVPAKFSWRVFYTAFLAGIWEWPILLIVLVGIYGGIVTITEVSVVVVVYIIFVESFIYKEVHFTRKLPGIMVEAAVLSGAIVVILGAALGFTAYLVDADVPHEILGYLTRYTQNKYMFLVGLNLFLLGVGCIMDIFSAIVIIVPVIVPIAINYGINPIHLCVIFLVNLEIGYSTPPVGMNLFIASIKFEKPITLLYRSSVPYLILLLLMLMAFTYIPYFSLWYK